ncbi:hypothetical protein [Kitasatospora sp. NPDC085464]|uniref:hypothetical protein n=1 Tax=Kitasatospora sp. NPDC085464 TaxID=3364063 RepID=UPI0037CC8096
MKASSKGIREIGSAKSGSQRHGKFEGFVPIFRPACTFKAHQPHLRQGPQILRDAPWAKDATGKSLNTRYRLEGNTLVQSVDTDKSTAFLAQCVEIKILAFQAYEYSGGCRN